MDRRVTPNKQFTSLIWGPSPPCEQLLRREGVRRAGATSENFLKYPQKVGVALIWFIPEGSTKKAVEQQIVIFQLLKHTVAALMFIVKFKVSKFCDPLPL